MRQFALFLDNNVKGPLSEYEIQDMIHAGQVTAETLCAPVGSDQWEPLSNHFTFGSGLRLARKPEATRSADVEPPPAPRLDTDQRRRLLMYGLADAATVDEIAPAQADALIAQTEARIRRQINLRRLAAVVMLGAGAAGGATAFSSDAFRGLLGPVADTAAVDEPASLKRWNRLLDEARRHEKSVLEALASPFPEPLGGVDALPVFLGRLKVRENQAYVVEANVQLSRDALIAPLEKYGISLGEKIAVLHFADDIPEEQLRLSRTQSETLALILSPLLADGQFAKMMEETLGTFPESPDIPEAARLRAELGSVKANELGVGIDKVLFRAGEAERIAAGRGPKFAGGGSPESYGAWARSLREFAGRLALLRDRIRINVNPEARREVWSDFNRGPGAELAAWALAKAERTVETGENGALRLDEAPNLRADALPRRFLVRVRIQEDTVLLPWDSPFLVAGECRSERIPNAVFLTRETYRVVSKAETGGRRHIHRGEVAGRALVIARESPRWHYISVARDSDTDVVTLRVDEALHRSLNPGQPVPVATLARYPVHDKPTESNPAQGLLIDN
jgi:hypothetical protein